MTIPEDQIRAIAHFLYLWRIEHGTLGTPEQDWQFAETVLQWHRTITDQENISSAILELYLDSVLPESEPVTYQTLETQWRPSLPGYESRINEDGYRETRPVNGLRNTNE